MNSAFFIIVKIKQTPTSICRLFPMLLLLILPVAVPGQVLVQDVFNGSGGALPDAAKYVWSGQLGQNGTGLLYLSTDTVDESWLRSIAGVAPGAGQTLDLQMRVYAYAESWNPGVYGDKQPRGLRVGTDANNVVEFYSLSHYVVGMRLRKDGVETLASYDLPSGVDTLHDYEISVTTTSAVFKVDGTVAGTFTTNIPTGVLNVYVDSWDGGGVGNVPIAIASLSLSLTNNQVQGLPVISGFTPTNGPVGTSVAINGTNFCGVTNVQFGGTTAVFTNNSTSLITAIVPKGTATGLITVVSTNGMAISSNNFVLTTMDFIYTTKAGTIIITGYIGSGGAVVIPETINGLPVKAVGSDAFAGQFGITSIVIPDSVTSIGFQAFSDIYGLNSVVIGNGVTNIAYGAFSDSVIPNVQFGTNIVTIGLEAFDGCYITNLSVIPASVTTISPVAFRSNRLGAFAVDPLNPNYACVDGVLFNKARTELIQYPCGRAGNYAVPSGVTNIDACAFSGSFLLTGMSIPASLQTLGPMRSRAAHI
jgi:hypothetical protein